MAITKLLTTEHINAMVKAMRKSNCFDIARTGETVVAKAIKSGEEVYRALKKGGADAWIVSHHNNLFQ